MRNASKIFLAVFFGIVVYFGNTASVIGADPRSINLPGMFAADDEEDPEVKDRVARISFIRGEGRVKRLGEDDWEKATLNLPIVEGDEIVTDAGSRIEIQFGTKTHLRLGENAYLKIAGLKDEGIAASLSLGTMNLRVRDFDKDKSFFEIDVPKTTVAIQKSGSYRIDAGREGDSEIRVAASQGGEARVYSDSAGFMVKNNRSARVFIDGPTSGEWETAEASRFQDEFDSWADDRDETIAKSLREAHYDSFYDQDIYGADELTSHGSWVHAANYGYIWRPNPAAIAGYTDWSPYRYGHWRWVSPHGWVWINDEPWGWATYHYGRWFHHNGGWHWSPYGHYRPRRSWWRGALVHITIGLGRTCWYPTPYYARYYDYNWHHRRRRNNNHQPAGPSLGPPGTQTTGKIGRVKGPGSGGGPGGIRIPPGGVVGLDTKDFGTKKVPRELSPQVIKAVLDKPLDVADLQELPTRADVVRKFDAGIRAERPKVEPAVVRADIGAAKRKSDVPLDNELRTTRVFGGRPPQKVPDEPVRSIPTGDPVKQPRDTGAVVRTPPTVTRVPKETRLEPKTDDTPVREPVRAAPKERTSPPPVREPTRQPPPSYDPPVKETPRPVRETPRESPPVKQAPPQKSEPKAEPKAEPKPDTSRKKSPDNN